MFKRKPRNMRAQFDASEDAEVPFAIILGEEELKTGVVTVKEQRWEVVGGEKRKIANEDKGIKIARSQLIDWIKGTPTYQGWSTGKLI